MFIGYILTSVLHAVTGLRKKQRQLGAPIKEAEVPQERIRGKASTFIIGAQDFMDFVVRADQGFPMRSSICKTSTTGDVPVKEDSSAADGSDSARAGF